MLTCPVNRRHTIKSSRRAPKSAPFLISNVSLLSRYEAALFLTSNLQPLNSRRITFLPDPTPQLPRNDILAKNIGGWGSYLLQSLPPCPDRDREDSASQTRQHINLTTPSPRLCGEASESYSQHEMTVANSQLQQNTSRIQFLLATQVQLSNQKAKDQTNRHP
jgi:hypothetical protein